jgi:hypothetical protein
VQTLLSSHYVAEHVATQLVAFDLLAHVHAAKRVPAAVQAEHWASQLVHVPLSSHSLPVQFTEAAVQLVPSLLPEAQVQAPFAIKVVPSVQALQRESQLVHVPLSSH